VLAAAVAGTLAIGAGAQPVTMTVDAGKTGAPIERPLTAMPGRLAVPKLSIGIYEFPIRGGDNMKSPLSMALAFHEMFRHSEMIGLVTYSAGFRTVLTDATGDAVGFRADGLVFKTLREHLCENLPVAVGGNSPQVQTKGTVGVDECARPSGSPTYPLDVLAALSADRKKLTVSVVNPTGSAQEFAIDVTGVQLVGAGKLWQIAAPSISAVNVAGQKPAIALMELPVREAPNKLTVPPSASTYTNLR
jgi:alpha-L-arabinofuranosidase